MTRPNCESSRNWMSYLMDHIVHSGAMPTWEATEYLTSNLIGDAPNTQLHETKSPYETIQQFLHRLYEPIVEAASRAVTLPDRSMIHMFTDISLAGNSVVLVVYFPEKNQPHQLLMLDGVRAWDLMFETTEDFNAWAEERYRWVEGALQSVSFGRAPIPAATELSLALA